MSSRRRRRLGLSRASVVRSRGDTLPRQPVWSPTDFCFPTQISLHDVHRTTIRPPMREDLSLPLSMHYRAFPRMPVTSSAIILLLGGLCVNNFGGKIVPSFFRVFETSAHDT